MIFFRVTYPLLLFLMIWGCTNSKKEKQLVYLATHLNYQLEEKNTQKKLRIDTLLQSDAMQRVYDYNLVIKAELRKLKKRTNALLDNIQKTKQHLIQKIGGGISMQTGRINDPINEKGVYDYMALKIGNAPQEGYRLKKRLDVYVEYLNTEFKAYGIPKFAKFAWGNESNALYRQQPKERNKDFAEAYFQDTSVIMALVYLSHFENTILTYQTEVIQHFLLHTISKIPH